MSQKPPKRNPTQPPGTKPTKLFECICHSDAIDIGGYKVERITHHAADIVMLEIEEGKEERTTICFENQEVELDQGLVTAIDMQSNVRVLHFSVKSDLTTEHLKG